MTPIGPKGSIKTKLALGDQFPGGSIGLSPKVGWLGVYTAEQGAVH